MPACPECQREVAPGARFCTACGAALGTAPPSDPLLGATVSGKFRVEALLGQGGMGRVYRARHLTLDRPVVLKVLHRAWSEDPQLAQRFQREARAASRLNHPNSIAVLDFGAAEDGTLYMAMEYLPGRDLARLLAEEAPLPERRLVRIGAQILSALAEAHAQGIIHRDLKPENVMVEPRRDEPDFVKVLDFGIAKLTAGAAGEPTLTQAGLVCGTPQYMSPEQARGADLDPRSDLYSVGVLLYQLATGDLPFQADTPVGFLTKHLAEAPLPVRRRRPDLSEALEALIGRALEKDRERRFGDAEEMRRALLACGGGAGEAAPPPATPAPPVVAAPAQVAPTSQLDLAGAPQPVRRGRRVALAGGLVAVVGAGAVVAALLLRPSPPPPAHPEREPGPATGSGQAGQASGREAPAPTPAGPGREPAEGQASSRRASTAASTPPPPDRARARRLVALGDGLRADGDLRGAVQAYLAAEGADPGLAEVQERVGRCYQALGDRRRAAERYRRFLAAHPAPADAARVRRLLAEVREPQG